jgi:hypothetical protein
MHAPLIADALGDNPVVRCALCGGTGFGAPDLAMQWANPVIAHLSAVCDECGTINHLRLGFCRGRLELSQRSTTDA